MRISNETKLKMGKLINDGIGLMFIIWWIMKISKFLSIR